MWNYRVIKKVRDGVDCYGIHEVYYADDGSPRFCTQNSCRPFGNNKGEVAIDLGLMTRALGEDVLNYDDFLQGEDIDLDDLEEAVTLDEFERAMFTRVEDLPEGEEDEGGSDD